MVADIGHIALSLYRPRQCDKTGDKSLHSAKEFHCRTVQRLQNDNNLRSEVCGVYFVFNKLK